MEAIPTLRSHSNPTGQSAKLTVNPVVFARDPDFLAMDPTSGAVDGEVANSRYMIRKRAPSKGPSVPLGSPFTIETRWFEIRIVNKFSPTREFMVEGSRLSWPLMQKVQQPLLRSALTKQSAQLLSLHSLSANKVSTSSWKRVISTLPNPQMAQIMVLHESHNSMMIMQPMRYMPYNKVEMCNATMGPTAFAT